LEKKSENLNLSRSAVHIVWKKVIWKLRTKTNKECKQKKRRKEGRKREAKEKKRKEKTRKDKKRKEKKRKDVISVLSAGQSGAVNGVYYRQKKAMERLSHQGTTYSANANVSCLKASRSL
jgi:mannitol-specific phosphotransferase system IIBC component